MKNKKLLKTIAASIVCSAMSLTAFALTGCGSCDGHQHTYADEWSSNGIYHWKVATCEHTDEVGYKEEHTFNDDDVCIVCEKVKQIIHATKSEADDPAPEVDADGKIQVKYEFNAKEYSAETYAEDLIAGIYTIGAGTTIRTRERTELYNDDGEKIANVSYTKSIQMSATASTVKIKAPAAGELVLHVQNGSSGGIATQKLVLTKPDESTEDIEYRAEGSVLQEVKIAFETEGEYKITRTSGTSDIFYMSYSAKVVDSPVESITVAATGNVDYYVGQQFGVDGLSVNAVHETTGRISPVDKARLEIDYSYFDETQAGTYPVTVSYAKGGKNYTTTYDVNVYSFESLKLGTDMIIQGKKGTAAGNGVYINHSLRQLYFKGETLSLDGLSVILNGKNGEKAKSFLLNEKNYTLSEVNTSTVGKKTVTVSVTTNGETKEGTFDIYVVEKDADLASAAEVKTVVDGSLADANVGVKNSGGAYQFKTVHQSLEFLENCGVKDSAAKTINLSAGTYWEKLEINVPNLTVIGADKDTTKIEYDSLYGIADDGGFEHVTDSTATLNVREKAVNFTIKNVTISNAYNSLAYFNQKLGENYPEHRALAVLIQADKVTVENCKMLGYQDTLELFTGRQYIVNTYISGTTDFIFGTNNTTYFENCQIHCIDNGKTDGGYITAFKGCNKSSGDAIEYGAIFDKCRFTADEGVLKKGDTVTVKENGEEKEVTVECGNTAIGRPWGAYAAVAVINSQLDSHISNKGFEGNGNSKNLRYVSMNAKPTDSTVKFYEYNNTGDGALTEAVGGMSILTADQAKNYSDLSKVFAAANGGVEYDTVWIPVRPGVETHTVTVYAKVDSQTVELGTLTIESGTKVVEDQIKALVTESQNYSAYDIVNICSDSECQTEYTYPDVEADGNIYVELHFETAIVSSVTINFKEGGNYADLTESGKLEIKAPDGAASPYKQVKNNCISFYQGSEISFEVKADTTIIVSAYGSSFSSYTVKIDGVLKTDLTGAAEQTGELTGNVEFTVDSDCKVTIVNGGSANESNANYLYSITVEMPKAAYEIGETIDFSKYTGAETIQNDTGKWNGVEIDATASGSKLYFRTAQKDVQCNVNTVLKFKVADGITAANITVVDYNGNDILVEDGIWDIKVEGGVATLKCLKADGAAGYRNYIKAIKIA